MDAEPEPPRFLADAMLGRLARWLRVLGLDTAGDEGRPDAELVRAASAEGRVLLTRDRALIADLRPETVLFVAAVEPIEQLRQVAGRFGLLPGGEMFTRCLVCNTPLRPATADEAAELVPPRSRGLPGPVRRCPGCGRVYWEGSHARRMRGAVARALGG